MFYNMDSLFLVPRELVRCYFKWFWKLYNLSFSDLSSIAWGRNCEKSRNSLHWKIPDLNRWSSNYIKKQVIFTGIIITFQNSTKMTYLAPSMYDEFSLVMVKVCAWYHQLMICHLWSITSDCRASKIIWNDTKLNPIFWKLNAENPLFNFCVGV